MASCRVALSIINQFPQLPFMSLQHMLAVTCPFWRKSKTFPTRIVKSGHNPGSISSAFPSGSLADDSSIKQIKQAEEMLLLGSKVPLWKCGNIRWISVPFLSADFWKNSSRGLFWFAYIITFIKHFSKYSIGITSLLNKKKLHITFFIQF